MNLLNLFILTLTFTIYLANKDFEIILEKATVAYLDTDLLLVNISATKVNRTVRGITVYSNVLKDFPSNASIKLTFYAFIGNKYQKLPLDTVRSVCEIMENELQYIMGDLDEKQFNHWPKTCPIKKGSHYLKDFIPTTKNWPISKFNFPWTKMKLLIDFSVIRRKTLVIIEIDVILDHDAEIKAQG